MVKIDYEMLKEKKSTGWLRAYLGDYISHCLFRGDVMKPENLPYDLQYIMHDIGCPLGDIWKYADITNSLHRWHTYTEPSMMELLAEEPDLWKEHVKQLPPQQRKLLPYSYDFLARWDQKIPTPETHWEFHHPDFTFRLWLQRAGRGTGKTFSLVQMVREAIKRKRRTIYVAARTSSDVEDTLIAEGFNLYMPDWEYDPGTDLRRGHNPQIRHKSGAIIRFRTGQKGDTFRGPNADFVAFDELPTYEDAEDVYAQASLMNRKGKPDGFPMFFVATTPRNIGLMKDIEATKSTIIHSVPSTVNVSNLNPEWMEDMLARYAGTDNKLGLQELYAMYVDDDGEALFSEKSFLDYNICKVSSFDEFRKSLSRVVIAMDPSFALDHNDKASDETGIMAIGKIGGMNKFVVIEDKSGRRTPGNQARTALELRDKYDAEAIVYEVNGGGKLVPTWFRGLHRDVTPYLRKVNSVGKKHERASGISGYYAAGHVFHARWKAPGARDHDLKIYEDQLLNMNFDGYAGSGSPDHADAGVIGIRYLAGIDKAIVDTRAFVSNDVREQLMEMGYGRN